MDGIEKARLRLHPRHGEPIDPRNFSRSFTHRCRKAGVPVITVHDARRTCGTLLAALDVHPRVAMEILRQAEFSLTMEIYTQASSEQTLVAPAPRGESPQGRGLAGQGRRRPARGGMMRAAAVLRCCTGMEKAYDQDR